MVIQEHDEEARIILSTRDDLCDITRTKNAMHPNGKSASQGRARSSAHSARRAAGGSTLSSRQLHPKCWFDGGPVVAIIQRAQRLLDELKVKHGVYHVFATSESWMAIGNVVGGQYVKAPQRLLDERLV